MFLCIEFLDEVIDGLSGAAWPLIRSDLWLSYTEIGLLFSIPTLVAHLIEPAIGLLGDVWRRFALIALGGLAYATALIVFAGANEFVALLAAMALLSPASGTFVSLAQSSLMDGAAGDEERSMVLWTVAGSVGVAVGPACLAGAVALGWGWRRAYAGMAAVALVLAVAVWLLRPNQGDVHRAERVAPREALREAWRAVRRAAVLRWLALLTAVDLLFQTFVGFLALYFVDELGTTAGTAAIAVTTWTIASLVGEAALIGLLRRFGGLRIVRASAPVVLVVFVAFMLAPHVAAKLALVALIGLFSAGWYSIVKAQFFRQMSGRTGTAMAVSSAFGPVEAVIPALVGVLAESFGLGQALWLVVIAPLAILALVPREEG